MEYTLNFEYSDDGLVFIDKAYLTEWNDDLLYEMDILLDPHGKTELICDFPNEDWDTVDCVFEKCEIEECNEIADSYKWLYLPTGKLLVASASELVQCLAYPELEMEEEKFFELSLESGWYAIQNEGIAKTMYCKKKPPESTLSNIKNVIEK